MSSSFYRLIYPNALKNEVEPTGGYVEVHITHCSHEAERNIATAILLAKSGYKIRLLLIDTTPTRKNPDAYFMNEGIQVEFKHNFVATRSAIENALRHAREQANYVLIHVLSEVTANDLIAAVKSKFFFYKRLESLWLIWQEQVIHLSRKTSLTVRLNRK